MMRIVIKENGILFQGEIIVLIKVIKVYHKPEVYTVKNFKLTSPDSFMDIFYNTWIWISNIYHIYYIY